MAADQQPMTMDLQLTRWQRWRTRLHLFQVGVRKRLTVGARAVLLRDKQVLLLRHTYVPGWHFPGGGVEPGETAETAAAREALEETGHAASGRPRLHGLFLNRGAGGMRDHVAVFVWREVSQVREFRPNLEIADCRWFDLHELPADIEGGTERRLREIQEGTLPPAEW